MPDRSVHGGGGRDGVREGTGPNRIGPFDSAMPSAPPTPWTYPASPPGPSLL